MLYVYAAALLLATATILRAAEAPSSQPASPIAPGATLQKLATGFKFTEGPATDSHGNVFFTDQPNDTIWKVDFSTPTPKPEIFLKPSGRSNGLCFDAHDNLIACADDLNQLWSIAPDKTITIVLKDVDGKLLNGPNDVWLVPSIAADGPQALYLTDPLYKRDYWKRDPKSQLPGEYVWYLSPDRKTFKPVATDLKKPNGIVGTADGKTLYVSDIASQKTYSYTLNPDGSLSEKKLFCPMGSDGMTIDSEGNLYLTNKGVTIFSHEGKQLAHIPVGENWTGNICFAGPDHHTLFITASTSVYTLQMRTHGVGSD